MQLEAAKEFDTCLILHNRILDMDRYSKGLNSREAAFDLLRISQIYMQMTDYENAQRYCFCALGSYPLLVFHADIAKILLTLIEISFKIEEVEKVYMNYATLYCFLL